MTDDLHTFIEPELQVRITAMVLGEASEFECDELEKLITEKPELAIYRRRLQAIHHLLDETVCPQRDSEWQLSEDKRERLRRTFANGNQAATPHKEQSTAHVQWRAAMGIAACLFVCLVIFSMMVPLAKRADMAYEGLDIKGGLDLGSEFQTTNEQGIPRTSELPVAGKLFDDKRRQTESAKKRPSVRSAVTGRGIASVNVPAPKKPSIPKPEVGFGNGDDFGDGFAGGDHGGDDADDDGVDPFAASEEEEVAEAEVDGEKAANQDKVVRREIPTRPSSGLAGEIPVGGKAYKSKQRGEEVLERSREAFKSEKSKGAIAGYVRPNDELGVSFGLTTPTNRPRQEHQNGRLHYYWRQNATATGTLGEGEDAKHDKGRDAFLAGDTVGNVNSRTATDFIHPSQGGQVPGASIATRNGKQVSNIATAGLRSGDFATTRSSIDAILNNPNRTKGKNISGIASVTGLLSDGQLALKKEKENTEYDEDAGFLSGGMGGGGAATINDKKPLGLYDMPASEGVQRDSSLRWHAGVSMGYDDGKGVDKDKSGFGKDSGIDTSSIAHKEIARRTRLVSESDQAFLEGREADAKKDYEEAARQYRKAGNLLPAGPAVEDRRHAIAGRLGDANAALAKKYRQEGKYAEARKTLEDTLRHDPTNEIAKKQLEYLSDPLRTGEPAHDQTKREVAEIRKGLYMGEGYYNLGKYDEAEAEMKKVLQKDPYNKAARRWLEKVAATKSDYYRAAYDETRAKLLEEVDKAWESAVLPERETQSISESKPLTTKPSVSKKENKVLSPLRLKALPEETVTSNEPFSTFSLNVNDVSFKLARVALLEKGQWPEAAKVRTEEFVNAFDYGDPSPRRGDRVACAVEQSAHPFLQQRNLLRVGMKTAAMGRSQPLRLTVLLDNSGSMERADREASVLAAMQVLAAQLGPQDVITVVGFARQPRLLADRVRGDQAGKLVELVAKTPSEGGTNIEEALRLARTLAKRQHVNGAQSRVVLITDGVANLGNTIPEELAREVETMRQQGIAFDACGVGAEGLNDDILESLTRKGDGRYYFLNRPEDADAGFARQLAGALTPAAKNVKVQVVFNPQRVSRYRLLGFEKHRLKKEDFRNDKVDAAEMAAEEAGNAVYQIQVNPEGEGELGEVFVRFLDASIGRMVERSWPLPYEPQAKPFDMAAPSMQLAGTAAMLGEKLHGTDAGSVRFSMIADTLGKLRAHYASDPKVQDLIRMCRKVK